MKTIIRRTTLCLLPLIACTDPVHESELHTASPTQNSTQDPLNDTYWQANLVVDEDWITADTTLHMQLSEIDDPNFGAWLRHIDGTLIPGDTEIPSDKWLKMDGLFLNDRSQIWLQAEDLGHHLTYDADLNPSGHHLSGYFTVDQTYQLYVELDRVSSF